MIIYHLYTILFPTLVKEKEPSVSCALGAAIGLCTIAKQYSKVSITPLLWLYSGTNRAPRGVWHRKAENRHWVPPINLSILLDRATKISVSVTDTFSFPYYIFSVACGVVFFLRLACKIKQPAAEPMHWIVSCSFAWLSQLQCLRAREVKLQVAEMQHGSPPCTQLAC